MSIQNHISKSNARKLLVILFTFELGLGLIYLCNHFIEVPYIFYRLFDLNRETNIPTWFSSSQLLLTGILFVFASSWSKWDQILNKGLVILLGLGFIFLSLDEASQIHEMIQKVLKGRSALPSFRADKGNWVFIYIVIGLVSVWFGIKTIYSFWKVYRREAIFILSGFILFFMGGVGLEVFSFQYLPDATNLDLPADQFTPAMMAEVIFEELLEMSGITLILYGVFLCHVQDELPNESKLPVS